MHPKLIDFGEISFWGFTAHPILHTYGFMLAVGFLLGVKLAITRGKKLGLEADRIVDLGVWILVSALLGAKLLLLFTDWEHYWHDPWSLLRSGGVFYGGLLAAIAACLWFFHKHRLATWPMADLIAPSLALGHAVGRLGCLSAGCCHGKPTTVAWGITFTDEYAREITRVPLGVPLHPTQLYEVGAELAIFAALLLLARKKRFDGQIFWTYVTLYAVARFVIEFFRGDERGFVFGNALSTSQFIGLLMLGAALVAMLVLRRRPGPRLA
jgi:phosphatidylglycerol:prolipoprotein diacylglycerol transferase